MRNTIVIPRMGLIIVLLASFIQVSFATDIWSLTFESAGGYSTSPAEFVSSTTDYFSRTDGSNISASFSNVQGSYYFAGQDIDATGESLPFTWTADDIDISGYTDLTFYIYLAEDDDGSNQDWDAADYMHIQYDIGNTGSFSNLIWVESSGATNFEPQIDTDFDGTGDGTAITSTFAEFSKAIGSTGSLIDIKITMSLNSGDEDIAFDNLRISGTASGGTPDPEPTNHVTSFTASETYQDVELNWTDAVTGDQAPGGYLILGETDATITDPTDETAVSDDTDPSGNSVAKNVAHGSGGSYTFEGLTANTTWYFEIFPYTNSGGDIDYKTDGTIPTANATTGESPSAPTAGMIYISEYSDASGSGNYVYEFVEVYNNHSNAVDVSGFTLKQQDAAASLTLPATTIIPAKGILVVGRNASEAAFESHWGVTFSASVTYVDGSNSFPSINGDETFLIENGTGTNLDPATDDEYSQQAISSSNRVYRKTTGNTLSDWGMEADGNATPGTLDNDQSLPVVLSAWKATSSKGFVNLYWITDSEIENQGFIVERRQNSETNSQKAWQEIASFTTHPALQGQGSTSSQTSYSFVDKQVKVGKTYSYRLSDVDYRGNVIQHDEINVTVKASGHDLKPTDVSLHAAYPNPFNPEVNLSFTLENEAATLSLEVYDLQGTLVQTLTSGHHEMGTHSFNWDGNDGQGNAVSSGVYMVRLNANSVVQIQRVTLLR